MRTKQLNAIAKGIVGKYCWNVSWERQINLELSFGRPRLRIRHPRYTMKSDAPKRQDARFRRITVKGEWWLWIFCAYWKLAISPTEVVTGASSAVRKLAALRRLDGQKLESVSIDSMSGRTIFKFDLGAVLDVRRMKSDDADIWTLYTPNGKVLGVQGDGRYSFGSGDTPTRGMPRYPMKPNKSLQVTPTTVTIAAYAPIAPVAGVPDL